MIILLVAIIIMLFKNKTLNYNPYLPVHDFL